MPFTNQCSIVVIHETKSSKFNHSVWKSQKVSLNIASKATFTFWVDKSSLKMQKNGVFWHVFKKVLPDRSLLKGQNWWKMPKLKNCKWDILSNFQTVLRVWEFKKAKLLWTQTDCVETIDKAERSVKCEMFSKSNSSSNDALYFAYLDLQFKEFSGYSGCIFGIVTHFHVHFEIHC